MVCSLIRALPFAADQCIKIQCEAIEEILDRVGQEAAKRQGSADRPG